MTQPTPLPLSQGLDVAPRSTGQAMGRGFQQCCPACGRGALYGKYLKVVPQCATCGTELHHHRADDAPPYFTMFVVGHVVIGALLYVERKYTPALWLHLALWLPLTLAMSLWLLPRIKGALIGLQWAQRMHGFDERVAAGQVADLTAQDVQTLVPQPNPSSSRADR